MSLRTIDPAPFQGYLGKPNSDNLGTLPELVWINLDRLRIDDAYQREIFSQGATNVGRIGREFDWTKFGIIVVARLQDGLFAIIDGQHRCIGASLRGVVSVPCMVVTADAQQQAAAFAAINGAVTAVSPLSIFHAQVEAKDPDALALKAICDAGGVTVMRYNVSHDTLEVGQTAAISALWTCYKTFKPEVISLALRCITRTHKGGRGMLRGQLIQALCHVLDAEPSFQKPEFRLLQTLEQIDYKQEIDLAEAIARKRRGDRVAQELARRLYTFLDSELGA